MKKDINIRQKQIIEHVKQRGSSGFADIFAFVGTAVAERTIKRDLAEL